MENKKAYRFFSEYTEDEKKRFLGLHSENIKRYLGQGGDYDRMIEEQKVFLREKLLSEISPIQAARYLLLFRLYPLIRKSIIFFGVMFIEPISLAVLLSISIFFLEKAKGNEINTVFKHDGRFLTSIGILGVIWFLLRLLNIISLRYEYLMEVRSLMSRRLEIRTSYSIQNTETNRPI